MALPESIMLGLLELAQPPNDRAAKAQNKQVNKHEVMDCLSTLLQRGDNKVIFFITNLILQVFVCHVPCSRY